MHDDLLHTDAEDFSRDLSQHGIAALPDLARARHDVERAIFVELYGRASDLDAEDAAALHRYCHATPAPYGIAVAAFKRFVPANGSRALLDAFRQSARTELTPGMPDAVDFFPLDRVPVAFAHGILAPEFQRVHAKLMRDFIDVRLQREKALRRAIAAHGTRDRQIGIDSRGLEVVCLGAVQAQSFMPCCARDGEAVRAICPRVAQGPHRERYQRAIALDAAAHGDIHGMSQARGCKFFLAGILDAHRAARLHRQGSGDGFEQHFLLAAEAAAYTRLDDAHAGNGQLQHGGQLAARVIGNLRAADDDQSVVAVHVCKAHRSEE